MLKFADVTYFRHKNYRDLPMLLDGVSLSYVYLDHLRQHADVLAIQHGIPEQALEKNGVRYKGFPGDDSFFFNPVEAHKQLKAFKPDVVLVQGLIFPVQTMLLRLALGSKTVILVQHHGEQPFVNKVKRCFQWLADWAIDGYLFTAKENAEQWLKTDIISADKCHEVLECSTLIKPADKEESRRKLGFTGRFNFLWVGRLNTGKDPLTVLKGFAQFLHGQPDARLYMIYQTEELLDKLKAELEANSKLKDAVTLVGKVPHSELAAWYSAADFFISGSHHEGSGYALIEAMACGCIPVVTRIPSFTTITGGGKYALQFATGDLHGLYRVLHSQRDIPRTYFSNAVRRHFETELSFEKISDDIRAIATELLKRKR